MVEQKIQPIIEQAKKEKWDISLFLLWKDNPEYDKRTVIISSKWIDWIDYSSAFNYRLTLFQKKLNISDLESIWRINFVSSDNAFVKSFNSALNVSKSIIRFKNSRVGPYFLPEAILFESNNK